MAASTDQLSSHPSSLSLLRTTPHFNVLWLEPLHLKCFVKGAVDSMGVTSAELRLMLKNYKRLGFSTLVIAYTEFSDQFMYQNRGSFSYYSHDKQMTICAADTLRSSGILKDESDFLHVFLEEANNFGLSVVIGLGRMGDLNLTQDMSNDVPHVEDRIRRVNQASKELAKDLFTRFGQNPAFLGWYLAHETHDLKKGMKLYAPVAEFLKGLDSSKKIMISPLPNISKSNYLKIVNKYKHLIDIYAYQDAIGAGTLFLNGYSSYHYSEEARVTTLAQHVETFRFLQPIHAQTGTYMWFNMEGWRMDGPAYGNAYPGSWESVQKQLKQFCNITSYQGNLMLNEGFLLFDFAIENAISKNLTNQQKASAFTNDYKTYLGI